MNIFNYMDHKSVELIAISVATSIQFVHRLMSGFKYVPSPLVNTRVSAERGWIINFRASLRIM